MSRPRSARDRRLDLWADRHELPSAREPRTATREGVAPATKRSRPAGRPRTLLAGAAGVRGGGGGDGLPQASAHVRSSRGRAPASTSEVLVQDGASVTPGRHGHVVIDAAW